MAHIIHGSGKFINEVGWHLYVVNRLRRKKFHLLRYDHMFRSRSTAYRLVIHRRSEVDEFLRSMTMLHPFKEMRRCWAPKILDDGMSKEQAYEIWQDLHLTETIAKIQS
ncbi:MAG: hypothetical protein QXF84_03885 [Nitrososphaerota archaeon]